MTKEQRIAGVDEAGRGPLAGPVFAAAVILDPKKTILGLKDSKQLSEKQREKIFAEIQEHSLAWAVGRAEVFEIDAINILQASLLAMQRAVADLQIAPSLVLVDGNRCPSLTYVSKAIVGGDQLIAEISAASIVAKVLRDREMVLLAEQYPQYGFAQHKGYPTRDHIAALKKFGASEIHRKTFAPVREVLESR